MTNQSVPDIPMLRKLVAWVEEEEQKPVSEREWDQWTFVPDEVFLRSDGRAVDLSAVPLSCGTAACVCGRLAMEQGATWQYIDGRSHFNGLRPAEYGAQILGITAEEAEDMFNGFNSAADVRRCAESIAARVGDRL